MRQSLLSSNPEGYAKYCTAIANHTDHIDVSKIKCPVLILTADEDQISNVETCETYKSSLTSPCKIVVIKEVGHWHVTEDVEGVAKAVDEFLTDVSGR